MAESLRDRVEKGFERWGRTVVSHPLAVLLASLAVACGCMAGLPRVYVDVTFEGLLGRKDEVRVSYEALREQFGRDERITIAVTDGAPGAAEDVFEFAFLEKLRALHETIEERVPHLVEITSLDSRHPGFPRIGIYNISSDLRSLCGIDNRSSCNRGTTSSIDRI